eukprot:2702387-Karenia_brevis.AAC.1
MIDAVLDMTVSATMKKTRLDGSLLGCSVSSDESPPNANRFNGLRFQITICHIVTSVPLEQWEHTNYDAEYPVRVDHKMCDLQHVPEKTGQGTYKVLCNQLSTLGVYPTDVCA